MQNNKFIKISVFTILTIVIALFVTSCNYGTSSSIEIDAPATITVGDTAQLTCNKDVLWHSCDPSIATITGDGYLETFKEGKVKIVASLASDENKTNYVYINVVKKTEVLNIEGENTLYVGASQKLSLSSSLHIGILDYSKFTWYSSDDETITVNEKGVVKALKPGFAVITVVSKETKAEATFRIDAINDYRYITITGETSVELMGNITLNATVMNILTGNVLDEVVVWASDNENVATVDHNGNVVGVGLGKACISAYLENNPMVKKEINIDVIQVNRYLEVTIDNNDLFVGDSTFVRATIKPFGSSCQIYWQSSDPKIATVNGEGKVTALSKGEVTFTGVAAVSESITGSITITIKDIDKEKPVISVDNSKTTVNVNVSVGKTFDPMYGIIALDDTDGDITDKVTYTGEINPLLRGSYTYTYDVTDAAGNKADTFTRIINVVWDYDVTFIGHAGCYYGGMNSEEAFLNAATRQGYNAVECDLRITKDGVFVLCHDEDFAGTKVASATWEELSKLELTKKRGGVTYTYKLCRLDTYLDICAKYDMAPVIEFKWTTGINSNDQSNMPKLMKLIEEKKLRDKVIFLTSMINCLKWLRNNGYNDVKCQYLVRSCASGSTLSTCVEYNFDISFDISNAENTAEWIAKYHAKGLKVSCYTINQYSTAVELRKWIDAGVDYVTVDHLKVTDASNMH